MGQFEIPGFTLPDRPRSMPSEPIVRSAAIEGNYRWELRRAWGSGPVAVWIGLNPSTADGKRDDPTMLREIGFSYRWGFGSLIKVNLYPYIASQPDALKVWRRRFPEDKAAEHAFDRNASRIGRLVFEHPDATFIAAWGKALMPRDVEDFLQRIAEASIDFEGDEDIEAAPFKLMCLGRNADGSPRHTLARGLNRIPDDAKLEEWK